MCVYIWNIFIWNIFIIATFCSFLQSAGQVENVFGSRLMPLILPYKFDPESDDDTFEEKAVSNQPITHISARLINTMVNQKHLDSSPRKIPECRYACRMKCLTKMNVLS